MRGQQRTAVHRRAKAVRVVSGKNERTWILLDDIATCEVIAILIIVVPGLLVMHIGGHQNCARSHAVNGVQRIERQILIETDDRVALFRGDFIVRIRTKAHPRREDDPLREFVGTLHDDSAGTDVRLLLFKRKPFVPARVVYDKAIHVQYAV